MAFIITLGSSTYKVPVATCLCRLASGAPGRNLPVAQNENIVAYSITSRGTVRSDVTFRVNLEAIPKESKAEVTRFARTKH